MIALMLMQATIKQNAESAKMRNLEKKRLIISGIAVCMSCNKSTTILKF